jgi:hypothetical protein
MEESDIGEPRAEWSENGVRVSGLERWHNVTAVFQTEGAAAQFEQYLKSGSRRAFAKGHFV